MTALVQASTSPGAPSSFVPDRPAPFVRAYALRVTSISISRALDEASDADERVPIFSLRADWAGDGQFQQEFSDLAPVVKSFTYTQELAPELPATVGFIEGTAASKLQVTLGGHWDAPGLFGETGEAIRYINGRLVDGVDAIYAFSPYGVSGPGPVVGAKIELRTGFLTSEGPVDLLRFSGTVSGYSPTASSREVVLDALDPVARLRKMITIYAYGVDGVMLTRYGNRLYPWILNSQWYIDRVLRESGYYASPPPGGRGKGSVTLSVTMHGSPQHEIGAFTYPITDAYTSSTATQYVQPWEYGVSADPTAPEAHPFQMMYPKPGFKMTFTWITRTAAAMRAGIDGWGLSGWVRVPSAATAAGVTNYLWSYIVQEKFAMQLRLIDGLPHAYIIYPTDGPNDAQALLRPADFALTDKPRWIFCGVHYASESGGVRVSMNFDGVYYSTLVNVPIQSDILYYEAARAVGYTLVPWTNFSIWYQLDAPGPTEWGGQTWTPNAYVDPGMNLLGGMTDIVARESYDLIKEIAAAEFATFYFDETGKPFFRSRIINRGWNRPPELLSSDRDISDLSMTVDDSSVRNAIEAPFAGLVIGVWETVWETDDPYYFTLGANSFNTWTIELPDNVVAVAETDQQIMKWVSSENWGTVNDNPYYFGKLVFSVSLLSDPTIDVYSAVLAGKLATAKFVFTVRRVDVRTVRVRIESFCPYAVRFATASKIGTNSGTGKRDNNMITEGEPAFRVPGRKMLELPTFTVNTRHERSIYRYGEQSYDLGGKNAWRQTGDATQLLSASVMQFIAKPLPVLSQVEVPHNPRRRLRDKIILTEPDSFGARIWCTIYGITTTYDENGARDILTLRPDAPPPGW